MDPSLKENQPSRTLSVSEESQASSIKTHYFEAETRRLKTYYLTHQNEMIGRRILFNNSCATVRYFGPLINKSETELWVGVEWDEAGRGKHNGTVGDHRYFLCQERKGSLLKFDKIEFGYCLETALFKRYFKVEELQHARSMYESVKELKIKETAKMVDPSLLSTKSQQETRQLEADLSSEETNSLGQSVRTGQALSDQDIEPSKEVVIYHDKLLQQKCEQHLKSFAKKQHKVEYDAQAYIETIKKSKRIMIEFIGFDEVWTKINNLDRLQSISLADCRICDLGMAGHLSALLRNLRILSLEDNLLSHWDQVLQLGIELPLLNELSLTNNLFESVEENYSAKQTYKFIGREETLKCPEISTIYKNLRCLILINTKLTWQTFIRVLPLFTQVEQFILCRNNMYDTENIPQETITQSLKNVRFINLEENKLQTFEGFKKLAQLPCLQRLILNRNPIGSFGRAIQGFSALKHLSVQSCSIVQPVVLAEISSFSKLQSLNIKHNPVGEKMSNTYVRMRAVAELPKLTAINGALLKKYERKDCQIYYMRESFHQYFAIRKVPDYNYDYNDFLTYCEQFHPNVPKLVARYGNPYEVQKKKEIQQIIRQEVKGTQVRKGTGMVEVIIQHSETGVTENKKLPLSWTLSSLKNFFSKTIKIPVNILRLVCFSDSLSSGQEMEQDHKTLSFYNLKAGSKIVTSRKGL